MTIQLALDIGTNDLVKTDVGGVLRVKEARYTTQATRSRLRTALGEWSLDPDIGWLNLLDFERNPDLFGLELRARKIILSTKDVNTIEFFEMTLDGNRKLEVRFSATSTYGEINSTINWE